MSKYDEINKIVNKYRGAYNRVGTRFPTVMYNNKDNDKSDSYCIAIEHRGVVKAFKFESIDKVDNHFTLEMEREIRFHYEAYMKLKHILYIDMQKGE